MKGAVLPGNSAFRVANLVWRLTERSAVPATARFSKPRFSSSARCRLFLRPSSQARLVALGLRFTSSSGSEGSTSGSECCSAARLMFHVRLWGSFCKTGHYGAVRSPSTGIWRVSVAHSAVCLENRARSWRLPSCFEIRKLDSRNMSGGQLRVRKEKVMAVETVVQVHGVQSGVKSTAPEEGMPKLSKVTFEVDSWQFQLLERHESSDLSSYTVAELRQLLRKMEKQPKGQKADLLQAVQCWLFEHGYPSPPAVEEESSRDPDGNSQGIGTPEEVAAVSKTRAAVSERIETQGGKKRTGSKSPIPANRKRRKDAEDEETDVINVTAHVERAKKELSKGKSSKKAAVKDPVVKGGIVAEGHKEPWTVLVHKSPQIEWLAYDPKTMRPKPLASDEKAVRLVSWNVNGLRALLKEKGVQHEQGSLIARLAVTEDFDVLCLQETKLQEKDVEDIRRSLLASHEESLWSCSTSKLGYSGTAIISRIKPLSVHYGLGVPEHDKEGRLITCEFDNFYFVVSYVPNSGAKLERLAYRTQEWDTALSSYLKELEKKKPVILTGDLNCAYENIDIHDPAGNKRSAGFTDEERESFRRNFLNHGFVDTFRMQHPNAVAYTYWGYRTAARPKNKGWRLDYFLVSESLSKAVHDSYTVPDVGGSDHCPIGLILKT